MSLPNVTAIQKRGRKGRRKKGKEGRESERDLWSRSGCVTAIGFAVRRRHHHRRRSVLYFLASFISDTAINASRPATQRVEHNAPFTIAAAAAAASLEDSTLSRGCNVKHGKIGD